MVAEKEKEKLEKIEINSFYFTTNIYTAKQQMTQKLVLMKSSFPSKTGVT